MGIPSPNGGDRQQAARKPSRVIPFGKYLLLERIAVGGMAEVYLAKSFGIEGFEKLLAIKRILPTMAEDDEFIEMFIDEAKIAGQLNHANIAPIFELGKIGDSHYIAMEYVWGKDLLQIMNRFRRLRKKMPPPMVAWVAAKMCEALDYAHNKRDRKGQSLNIIHRDISPQNVLVSYEGEVKLIDFGIAKAASRTTKTQAGVLKGKFGYMSPEQVRGLPIDLRSDLFAVGTSMYEMLTGERLFMGESDFSTLEKVRNADVAPVGQVVSDVPSDLEQLVMKALQRDASDRFQSAAELQEHLQRFLAAQRPPFGTSKLGAWLKTAFAAEMAKEKGRLDSYAHIGRPSVLSGPRKAQGPAPKAPPPQSTRDARPAAQYKPPAPGGGSAVPPRPAPLAAPQPLVSAVPNPAPVASAALPGLGGDDDLEADKTMVSASPFEETAAASAEVDADEAMNDEPTQIFFSADELEHYELDRSIPSRPPAMAPPAAQATVQGLGGIPGSVPPGGLPPMGHSGGAPPMGQPGSVPPMGQPGSVPPMGQPGSVPPMGQPGSMPPAGQPHGMPPMAPGSMPAGTPISAAPPPQRGVHTMELDAGTMVGGQPAQERGSRGLIAMVVVAAILLLAAGAGGAYFLLGGEPIGTLEIRTVPPVNAAVKIDGVPRGAAPLRVEGIEAGPRVIEIQADGFETATRHVNVEQATTAMLEVALIRSANPATVAVEQPAAPTTPEAPALPGEQPMEATAENPSAVPSPSEEPVTEPAPAPEPREVVAAAPERPRQARQERQPTKRAARTPRAQERTPTRPTPRREVPEVRARPRAEEPTRRPPPETPPQERTTPAGQGTLVVNSIPWSRVFIDGRDTGQNTPVQSLRVTAGTHRVGLRTADGEMHTYQVEVAAGATVRVMKRL